MSDVMELSRAAVTYLSVQKERTEAEDRVHLCTMATDHLRKKRWQVMGHQALAGHPGYSAGGREVPDLDC